MDEIADVVLTDGRTLSMDGLFTQPCGHLASPVAEQRGCALAVGPMGRSIRRCGTPLRYVLIRPLRPAHP